MMITLYSKCDTCQMLHLAAHSTTIHMYEGLHATMQITSRLLDLDNPSGHVYLLYGLLRASSQYNAHAI